MCGICAIIFEPGVEADVGRYLFEMAHRMQIRAQDSAGFAVVHSNPRENVLVQVMETNPNGHNGQTFRFVDNEVAPSDLEEVLRGITQDPNQAVVSHGRYMEIRKDLGLASEVNAKHGIDKLVGSHGMGHLRIATSSSDITPRNAHPFGILSRQDLAVLHNGEINNNGRLRMDLERMGHPFVSGVDSETIGVFVADRLNRGFDLAQANYEFIEKGDGPFAYIIINEQGIAVVRDRFGLRKVMVGYHPGSDTTPGFVAMATDVSALNAIGANRDVHVPRHGSVEVYYKDRPFEIPKSNDTFFGGIKTVEMPGTYVIDVNKIRGNLATLKGLSEDEQKSGLEDIARKYGIHINNGLISASFRKFGSLDDSPIILTRIVNAILEGKVAESIENIELRNTEGLYSLAGGLEGRIDLTVRGDVGNSFASYLNIDGVIRIYGTVENGLANHGFKGRVVAYGIVTELAGITNYGVDILIKGIATERIGSQMRGGSIVTFGLGYNSGLYMNGGVLLNLGQEKPGEELGSGMTAGVIYAPNNATQGRDTKRLPLDPSDYETIKDTLEKHRDDLGIRGLEKFSAANHVLQISNGHNGHKRIYDFSTYVKIVPK